jgi:predicted metal-dependent hydrolase
VQLEWLFGPRQRACADDQWLVVGSRRVQLRFERNRRARRYVLRLRPDGAARVTVPRGGSITEARRFAERNVQWLERQLLKQALRPVGPRPWTPGTEILFRGEPVRLEPCMNGETGSVRVGDLTVPVADVSGDLRPAVEWHLRSLATKELPARVFELATQHQLPVRRVTVRNQRSRWGSCSRRGTISLNWRLVQTPVFVRDYIILHELAHFKEMNHSRRFWSEVSRLCPEFREAEQWLKAHSGLLS